MGRAFRLFAPMVAAAVLTFAPAAQAQITIGQLAPGSGYAPVSCSEGPLDRVAAGAATSAYSVPTTGVITSWSTKTGAELGQRLVFKVYRPLGNGKYLVVGREGPQSLMPSAVDSFPTTIPVQAGDVIGNATVAETPSPCFFGVNNSNDKIGHVAGDSAVGLTIGPVEQGGDVLLNETATILPPPTLSAVTPASGSIAGGASVAISGTNLAEVKAVGFGATPAASFTVGSESQIDAVTPPTATLGRVPVTVTTVAGTATAQASFTYEGCAVPKLTGKKLKAARKKLIAARCKLGKVTKKGGATAKSGKVKAQRPKPRKVLVVGAKVNVTLRP